MTRKSGAHFADINNINIFQPQFWFFFVENYLLFLMFEINKYLLTFVLIV